MIVITHLREDYRASGIAARLALYYMDLVEVIPKDYRRKWVNVKGQLEEADAVIFIMVDEDADFDKGTSKELNLIVQKQKPLYIVVPEKIANRFKNWKNLRNVKIFTFNPDDPRDIMGVVGKIVEEEKNKKKNDIVDAIIITGLLMLFALILASSPSKK